MDRTTNNIVPSRPTPNPRQSQQHQESAADYMRAQIAQIYDEPDTTQAPSPKNEPQQQPRHNPEAQRTEQEQQESTNQ